MQSSKYLTSTPNDYVNNLLPNSLKITNILIFNLRYAPSLSIITETMQSSLKQ